MNASTPEHRPPHDRRRPLADAPVRVEELAEEPCEVCGCPGDKYDGHCCEDYEQVAQSANADVRAALQVFLSEVRRAADALQETEYEPETVISALGYLGALQPGHAEDDVRDESVLILRSFLDGALPVPVGDETEALRKRVDCGGTNCGKCQQCLTVHEYFLKLSVEHLRKELDDALARVAGLEAREAWPWVPEPHEGEHCQDCGRGYSKMLYSAADDTWARLAPDVNLLCPPCFDARARTAGITLWWEVSADEWPSKRAALADSGEAGS